MRNELNRACHLSLIEHHHILTSDDTGWSRSHCDRSTEVGPKAQQRSIHNPSLSKLIDLMNIFRRPACHPLSLTSSDTFAHTLLTIGAKLFLTSSRESASQKPSKGVFLSPNFDGLEIIQVLYLRRNCLTKTTSTRMI